MHSNKMPSWLVVLLTVVGVVFLGPPALVMAFVALGLLLSLGVAALKVALVALAVAGVVLVLRALFGRPRTGVVRREPEVDSLEVMAARLEAEEAERRAALDRQLDEALRSAR